MPHMTSVSLGLWVGVGGRYEPAEANGVCHFIEHLLFKGTRRRSARQISQDVEGIGGYLNAFTSEEMTCYHSKARHDRFDELLDVLDDMFLNSRFDPVEIDKERERDQGGTGDVSGPAAALRPGIAKRNAMAATNRWAVRLPARKDAGRPGRARG